MYVLSELTNVVASRKVVGNRVPLAVVGSRSSKANFARITPHNLGKVTLALLKVLVVVVVVGLLVPLVGHLTSRQLLARRREPHGDILAERLIRVRVLRMLERVRLSDALGPRLRHLTQLGV